jgi:membrane-associated phospholipid phosphatase
MGWRSSVVGATLAVALVSFVPSAGADPDADPPDRAELVGPAPLSIGPSYLWDGGAVPFFWGALAARIALDKSTDPPEAPRLFSHDEGGAAKASWEVPGWVVTGMGVGAGGAMLLGDDPARWYHAKGLAQSLATGSLVTGLLKTTFGRHRPDWIAGDGHGQRRSFPSGHTTQAFAIAAYSILYLRAHVFDRYRGDRDLPWWEAATYGGIALGAVAVGGERVLHNRHHLTDVGVGALLGTATSTLFFMYQEGRYQRAVSQAEAGAVRVTPSISQHGAALSLSFTW